MSTFTGSTDFSLLKRRVGLLKMVPRVAQGESCPNGKAAVMVGNGSVDHVEESDSSGELDKSYEDDSVDRYDYMLLQNHLNGSATNCAVDEIELLGSDVARPLIPRELSKDETTDEDGLRRGVPESSRTIAWQVAIPFFIAGLGMVGAGLVLDVVQHWEVFRIVSEVFILVPALLGLKGNLEMTLASRLSTQANLGNMDLPGELTKMAVGNLALVQCQATVVSFLASIAAIVMGWIPDGDFDMNHALILCASSLITASIASFVLGAIMIGVVILSRKCNVNPDNVATPIAASLGDLTTLSLLAGFSSLLYYSVDKHIWLAPSVILGSLLLMPLWIVMAKRNRYTSDVLYTGWTPVISAMGISSVGGLVLDFTVSSFKGVAVFQPVINGVGGNLVAVQSSRISTSLHQVVPLGKFPENVQRSCVNPCSTFFGKDIHSRTARVLLLLVVPGHLVFAYTISYVKAGHTSFTPLFLTVYLSTALLQVAVLLYISHVMVHWMWSRGIDPDNSAIPYLTALGDLFGIVLLSASFALLYVIGDKDSDVGD